jgi:hypothetical protein
MEKEKNGKHFGSDAERKMLLTWVGREGGARIQGPRVVAGRLHRLQKASVFPGQIE